MKPHSKIISKGKEYILGSSEIGGGSFGRVWTAWDGEHDTIAVKFFAPAEGLSFRKYEARFAEEAKRMNKIFHPNIIRVYEFQPNGYGEIEHPYYTMELARSNLFRYMPYIGQMGITPSIHLKSAITAIESLCSVLIHAYEEGLKAHTDIHPGNILITSNEKYKLADFGMMLLEQEEVKTYQHTMLTALENIGEKEGLTNLISVYTSPEVREGGRQVATQQSDIYSLGVILQKLIEGEVHPKTDELLAIAYKATRIIPESRYQSVRELESEIKELGKTVPSFIDEYVARNNNLHTPTETEEAKSETELDEKPKGFFKKLFG